MKSSIEKFAAFSNPVQKSIAFESKGLDVLHIFTVDELPKFIILY